MFSSDSPDHHLIEDLDLRFYQMTQHTIPGKLRSLSTALLDPQILHYLIFHTASAYSASSQFKKYVILTEIFLENQLHQI
jgi:hypothetical protein